MVSERPQGPSSTGAEGGRKSVRPTKPRRGQTTIVVSFRGGSECWWELRSAQGTIRRPGHLSLHDVMRELVAPE